MNKIKKYVFFLGGLLIMLCMTLSSYGIATVTPQILMKYDAMEHYTLTSIMASIGMLLFLPICGKLIDTVERKPMLIIGGLMTLIPSFVCGFAPDFPVFIASRFLITVGTACVAAIPSASLPLYFEKKELPGLYGIQGGVVALGTFFGATIAGIMCDYQMTWLAVAYPGILTVVGCALMYVYMPETPKRPMPHIDFAGILMLGLFVGPLTFVSSMGKPLGWASPVILGSAAVMIGAVFGLVVVEKKVKQPLIDIQLFQNPVFTAALAVSFFAVCYQSAMRVYVPLQVQTVLGASATASGTVLLPRSIINMVLPTTIGAWIGKKMQERIWKAVCLTGLLIAVGMAITGAAPSIVGCAIGLGITGIAECFKQSSVTPAATNALPQEQYGSGMSLISMAGTMGSAVGAAVFGIIQDAVVLDLSNIEQVSKGNQIVFFTAAATGMVILFLGLTVIRPKRKNSVQPV